MFSTHLANKAGEAVWRRTYDNILLFHRDRPKGSGFLQLPGAHRRQEERSESPGQQSTDTESEPHPPLKPRDTSTTASGVRRSRRLAGNIISEDLEPEVEPTRAAVLMRRSRRRHQPLPQSPVRSVEEESEQEETEEVEPPTKQRRLTQLPQSPREPSPVGSPEEHSASKPSADQPIPAPPTDKIDPEVEKPETGARNQQSPDSPVQYQSRAEEVNYTICHGTPETRKAASSQVQKKQQVEAGQQMLSPSQPTSEVSQAHEQRSQAEAQSPVQDPASWTPAQYPHPMAAGYPSMYGRHLAYPHVSQAGANYPYPIPYPWPHPPHAHHQGGADIQHAFHGQHVHPTVGSPPLPWPTGPRQVIPTQTSSREISKQHVISEGMSHQPGSTHPPHPSGHPLCFSHHPPHDPSTSFHYGFESRHPSLAHMWSPAQLPHPQLHALMPAAPHLAASQGLWYPHNPASHQRLPLMMGGVESNISPTPSAPDKVNKTRTGDGGKAQLLEPKQNSNQSNNSDQRAILEAVPVLYHTFNSTLSKAPSVSTCLLTTTTTDKIGTCVNQGVVGMASSRKSTPTAISSILEQTRLTNELSGNS